MSSAFQNNYQCKISENMLFCICNIYPTILDMENEIRSNKNINSNSKQILNCAIEYRKFLNCSQIDIT